jgi:hypothetical protein
MLQNVDTQGGVKRVEGGLGSGLVLGYRKTIGDLTLNTYEYEIQ